VIQDLCHYCKNVGWCHKLLSCNYRCGSTILRKFWPSSTYGILPLPLTPARHMLTRTFTCTHSHTRTLAHTRTFAHSHIRTFAHSHARARCVRTCACAQLSTINNYNNKYLAACSKAETANVSGPTSTAE
jgi:hypothetical protein